MLPPQVLFGAGVLLGKAAKWAFGGGGGGSGGGGVGGGLGGGGGDDLGDCREGWVCFPDGTRSNHKWLAVPASRAHLLRPDNHNIQSFEQAVAEANIVSRRSPEDRYLAGYIIDMLHSLRSAHPGYEIFIVKVY